jgi:hypothetical protein
MKDIQARPCPLCSETDEDFGNVTRIYTRAGWAEHCRQRHPGLDPVTLWQIPIRPAPRGFPVVR